MKNVIAGSSGTDTQLCGESRRDLWRLHSKERGLWMCGCGQQIRIRIANVEASGAEDLPENRYASIVE